MKKIHLAIMGIGTVGGGTYRILTENAEFLRRTQGVEYSVKKVLDKNAARVASFGIPESTIASNVDEIVNDGDISIVVETMGGVEPAKTFITKILESGKSVVTANKELVSKHWPELEAAAKRGKSGLYIEASCVGGVPIIRTLQEGMQANRISEIIGIINGTTNYILTKMTEEGMDYGDALKEAQQLGFAEFDPTSDVEGYDAAYKLSILSSIGFHTCIPNGTVYREGIAKVSKEDIRSGLEFGYRLKLLAIGKRRGRNIEVRVHPTFVPSGHPLASVSGPFNAVFLKGDFVDDIMLYGRGAGADPTGSAIVSDIVYASKRAKPLYSDFKNNGEVAKDITIATDFNSKYYISLRVKDELGLLSAIAGVFGKNKISVDSVKQISKADGTATLAFMTHDAKESNMMKALGRVEQIENVIKVESLIRVL